MIELKCQHCGMTFFRRQRTDNGKPKRFCSHACYSSHNVGENRAGFKGESAKGYLVTRDVGNPRAQRNHVGIHIVVAERALGHYLPAKAEVHHVDGNKHNNRNDNLVICENGKYHKLLHARKRHLDDVGSFSIKRCSNCKSVKPLQDFHKTRANWDGLTGQCKQCNCARQRAYKRTHGRN